MLYKLSNTCRNKVPVLHYVKLSSIDVGDILFALYCKLLRSGVVHVLMYCSSRTVH